jgi:DNA topoisomerase-1
MLKSKYILVIVESPGKIKKLGSILGSNYVVEASFGHIIDLHPKKLSVNMETFEPEYHIIIAADDDREGEMIGWSCMKELGLKDKDYERITFNSITKDEVKRAIANPGKINMLMVESQRARRIQDRIVGFKISPKLNQAMGTYGLSAGRVQSIVCKLICDKEEEIIKFFEGSNSSYFKILGYLNTADSDIKMKCDYVSMFDNYNNNTEDDRETDSEDSLSDKSNKLKPVKLTSYSIAKSTMDKIKKSSFKIYQIKKRTSKRNPSAPYTTSTVQQDASTKINFNVKRTMKALQNLYEAGYTTYMRTDSTNLSKDALSQCKKYIKEKYGNKYYRKKIYKNSKGNTQEAHEAIRPVKINKVNIPSGGKIGADEKKIYNLVWKRTIASQMRPAEVDVFDILISISKLKDNYFKTSIEDITFAGYLAVYNIGTHGQDYNSQEDNFKVNLPKKKEKVLANEIKCTEEYKKPPLRYSEAGLVKKMDPRNLNIGRPATYAQTISTIQDRNYVKLGNIEGIEKSSRTLIWKPNEDKELILNKKKIKLGKENKKFYPTKLGLEVNKILVKSFPDLMDYDFTSNMENQLDDIADGKIKRVECLKEFWDKLRPLIEKVESKDKRVIGNNPETGYEVIACIGKYGPMLKMARSENKKDIAYAPIKSPYTIEDITLEQALEILKYPKILGTHKKKSVELKKGLYGFYVAMGKDTGTVPKHTDIDKITLKEALKYIQEKKDSIKTRTDKYLYYKKENDKEYIVNTGKYGDNNKYIMIRDTKKKTTKPIFLPYPNDTPIEKITIKKIKELVKSKSKNKK